MKLNVSKTKEVFCCLKSWKCLLPSMVYNIQQVEAVNLLGFMFENSLKPAKHLDSVISKCNQHLFLLNQIKKAGAQTKELEILYISFVQTRVLYCSALFIIISKYQLQKLQRFYDTAYKRQFLSEKVDIEALINSKSLGLFQEIQRKPNNILHQLLPQKSRRPQRKVSSMYSSQYCIDKCRTETFRQSFFCRHLFCNL